MPGTSALGKGKVEEVIWTDESSFSTAGFGHRPWVIRKADEEYHPDCIDRNFHSGRKSKVIWGAFCGTTKSQTAYAPGRAKIDAATYVRKVLEPAWAPFGTSAAKSMDGQLFKETTLQDTKGIQIAIGH